MGQGFGAAGVPHLKLWTTSRVPGHVMWSWGEEMPRPENQLDPDAGPIAAFACDLRALREESGYPSYRVLAKRAGFSASTLSVAASGAALPSLDVTLAYVQACGGDPEPWHKRWRALADEQPFRAVVAVRASQPGAQAIDKKESAELTVDRSWPTAHSVATGAAMAVLGSPMMAVLGWLCVTSFCGKRNREAVG